MLKPVLLSVLILIILPIPSYSQLLVIESGEDILLTEPATYDSIRVMPGGILTADAVITVLEDVKIQPGGSVGRMAGRQIAESARIVICSSRYHMIGW